MSVPPAGETLGKAYPLPGDRGSSSFCCICITRETNALASCGISENFSSCWAQPWAFPDFSPNLAQEIGEQCRLLLGVPLILFVKGWAPWSRWHRRSREGKEQHPWTTEFSLPLQRLPKTRVCLDRVRPRGRGRCGCKGVGRGGVQVWLRSVWQPSLPRTENYDARAGSTSAILFADSSGRSGPGLSEYCLEAWSFVQPALFLPIWASFLSLFSHSSREDAQVPAANLRRFQGRVFTHTSGRGFGGAFLRVSSSANPAPLTPIRCLTALFN